MASRLRYRHAATSGQPIEVLRQALRLEPEYNGVVTNLGALLVAGGNVDDGIALLRQAVANDPANAVAFTRLAHALFQVGQLGDSIAAAEAAIRVDPDHADAHSALAIALGNQGRLTEASAEFQRVLELEPDNATAFSNLLFLSNYDADLPLETLAERHRAYGRRFERVMAPPRSAAVAREAGRRLRVGYVSADFRQHSVAYFVGIAACGARPSAVEVICYANVAAARRDHPAPAGAGRRLAQHLWPRRREPRPSSSVPTASTSWSISPATRRATALALRADGQRRCR